LLAQVLPTIFFLITYMLTMIQMLPALRLSKNLLGMLVLSGLMLMGNVSLGQTTYTQNFDTPGNWGGGAVGSYNGKTYFQSGQPVTFAASSSIRETAGAQDGFAKTRGGSTHSWRMENAANNWIATIASGGVGTFSVWVRRWDNSPDPNYVCEYSVNNGTSYTPVQTINNAWLTTSDWKQISGTINTSNTTGAADDIIIRIRWASGERLMVDDFVMTDHAASATPTVNLSVNASSGTEAGTTVITATATASAAVTGAQTVDIAVTGTGITAGDYTLSGTSISIANGATTGSVTFTIANDAVYECTETATLTISNPSAGMTLGSTATQDITITDNDFPTANLSINTTTGSEAATTSITLTATASAAVIGAQTVSVGISGTGVTNSDFSIAFPTTITIADGATTGTRTFTVADDASFEGAENATFTISSPSSCLALGATTTQGLAITDNDFPAVNLSINAATGTEAATTSITLTATASAAVSGDQTVNVALSGTGLAATDFTGIDFSTAQTITILNGATTGTRTFAVADDAVVEGPESATFTISSPTSGISLGSTLSQSLAITDNDAPANDACATPINLTVNAAATNGSMLGTTPTNGTLNQKRCLVHIHHELCRQLHGHYSMYSYGYRHGTLSCLSMPLRVRALDLSMLVPAAQQPAKRLTTQPQLPPRI
jgi:hypothetical protein